MKAQKKKKSNKKHHSIRLLTAVLIIFIPFLLAYFLFVNFWQTNSQSGELDTSQTHPGEALRQSLDLHVAAKADYPSSPLSVYQDLGVQDGLKQQIIHFAVRADGLNEAALLIEPSGAPPAGGFPAIILCHGYIDPAEYLTEEGYINDMEFYARNGFAVIKPDFRGQGDSAGQGQPNSAYYSMDYNTDVMSLISSLKQTKGINPDNISLWGHSMGAYIALRASVLSPDIKHTVLLAGPVSTMNKMYLDYVPPSDENNPSALKTRAQAFAKYGTPGEDTTFWKNASPPNFLSNTSVRYQIHVGAQDPVVPPVFSAQLDGDLTALKRSHEYYSYDTGNHNLLAQRPLIWSRSLAFLRQQ
jgi:uncharacterized protein